MVFNIKEFDQELKPKIVSSLKNPLVKLVNKLKETKHRKKLQLILIQGVFPIKYALENNYRITKLIVCPELFNQELDYFQLFKELAKQETLIVQETSIIRVSPKVFKHVSYNSFYEGIIAVAKPQYKTLDVFNKSLKSSAKNIFLLADGIENTSTLGGLLRIVDNTGITGIILVNKQIDLYHPGVIRSSLGATFTVKHAIASLDDLRSWTKQNNIFTVSTTPNKATLYNQSIIKQINKHKNILIAIGAEHKGLSQDILKLSNLRIKIPMWGKVESLSATATAAILLYDMKIK